MNLPTPPNHLGGHWKLFSEHVFSPPHVHTLYGTRSTFTLQHHQRPPFSHSLSHQTSFLHHSPHQLTIYNHPSSIPTLEPQNKNPHFDFKIPPHYYIYDTPKHIQSLLEHHQTPQTPPKSSYISSKHLSNPPRTIKHDFQHQQYTTDLEFTGT